MESGRFRKKKVNFSMVSNNIIRDKSISLKAKGLYTLIQSYITLDGFTLYKSFLMRQCCEGERAFDTAWKELKETGYLKMYKIREGAKTFFYEYELLDEPDIPQEGHSVDLQNVGVENETIDDVPLHGVKGTKCGSGNKIVPNNDLRNDILSNQIISIEDVKDQVGFIAFSDFDKSQVEQIALLMVDILNLSDDATIKINKVDLPVQVVKARFMKLNQFHIQYVLSCMKQNTNKIANIRNYLLTTLFNAPTSIDSFYQNQVNHDLYG